jgi:hypothetical protein
MRGTFKRRRARVGDSVQNNALRSVFAQGGRGRCAGRRAQDRHGAVRRHQGLDGIDGGPRPGRGTGDRRCGAEADDGRSPSLRRLHRAVPGDGIFALFGAPVAHEDHPQRALSAALRMQDEVSRYADRQRAQGRAPLQIRIGVNTGEVVVRSIATGDGKASTLRSGIPPTSPHGCRLSRRWVAFGVGIHACIGANLARLKGRIVLGSVVERFSRLRLSARTSRFTTMDISCRED